MDIDRLPWESKVFVIQRKLRCHKRGIVSYTLWRKGLLGRSGFFTLFFHTEICSTNLSEKPSYQKNQVVFHLESPKCLSYKESLDAISKTKRLYLGLIKFFYSFLSNISYPDFCTAKHQLITNSGLLDWRLCSKACETRLIHGNNEKAYWGIKWFFTLFFHTSHIS